MKSASTPLLVIAMLFTGCSDSKSGSDTSEPDKAPDFENSAYYGTHDCADPQGYWLQENFAVRITPPSPPWQLNTVKANLLKMNNCQGGPLELTAVVTTEELIRPALVPHIDDKPVASITVIDWEWDAMTDLNTDVEAELEEPLLVEEEGDLYLVATDMDSICLSACTSTDTETFYVENVDWEPFTMGSVGFSAGIEW